MDETTKQNADSTQKGQNSQKVDGSNSNAPKVWNEDEHNKAVTKAAQDAVAQYGDKVNQEKIMPLVKERDTLKQQLAGINVTKSENDELNAQIAELTRGDVDKATWIRLTAETRETNKKLNEQLAEREAILAARDKAISEKYSRVEEDEREAAKMELLGQYDGITIEKINTLAEGVKDFDALKKTVSALFTRKQGDTLVLDSGRTNGGGIDLSKLSDEERFGKAINKMFKEVR